jgi:hypothetical protein
MTKAGKILYIILFMLNSRRCSITFLRSQNSFHLPHAFPFGFYVTEVTWVSSFSASLKGLR